MAARLVVGLFRSGGIALDAYHRLRTEGVPAHRLAHRVLKEVGPPPSTMQSELEALDVDPLVRVDLRRTFAPLIHNGETAVAVDAGDEAEAEFAAGVLWLYDPLSIETVPAAAAAEPPCRFTRKGWKVPDQEPAR